MKLISWPSGSSFSIWHYEPKNRNYIGFHCTGNSEAIAFLCSLLDDFLLEKQTQLKTLILASPSDCDLRVVGCKSKSISQQKLTLTYLPENENSDLWLMQSRNNILVLSFGSNTLGQLRTAIAGIAQGKGDFCLGEQESALWFWWQGKK